jgi:hypothetical protein
MHDKWEMLQKRNPQTEAKVRRTKHDGAFFSQGLPG